MDDAWVSGVAIACCGSIEVVRVTCAVVRNVYIQRMRLMIGWYTVAGVGAWLAAHLTDDDRGLATDASIGALAGVLLVGLGVLLSICGRRRVVRLIRTSSKRFRGPIATHVLIAAVWAVPLALAVSVLLQSTVDFPRTPVFWNTVVLTVVGSGFTEDRRVLLVGLKCAVIVAVAGVVAVLLGRADPNGVVPTGLFDGTSWMVGAVLLFGSLLVWPMRR